MHNDCSDHSELRSIRELESRRQEQGRIRLVLDLIEEPVRGDDGRDVVGQAQVVKRAGGRDGEVSRKQNVFDYECAVSERIVKPSSRRYPQYMIGAMTQ